MRYVSRKTLKALFHMGAKEYKDEYEHRFNSEDTIHLPVSIGNDQALYARRLISTSVLSL